MVIAGVVLSQMLSVYLGWASLPGFSVIEYTVDQSQAQNQEYTEVNQSDGYAMISGDRNSADASLNLSYKVAKMVALAINDGTPHVLFQGSGLQPSKLYSDNLSGDGKFEINGAIFANADNVEVNFGSDIMTLYHDSLPDENQINMSLSADVPTSSLNQPFFIDSANFENGIYHFSIHGQLDEIPVYLKAGHYSGSLTITTIIR